MDPHVCVVVSLQVKKVLITVLVTVKGDTQYLQCFPELANFAFTVQNISHETLASVWRGNNTDPTERQCLHLSCNVEVQ